MSLFQIRCIYFIVAPRQRKIGTISLQLDEIQNFVMPLVDCWLLRENSKPSGFSRLFA